MTSKQKDLTKNFFALGIMFWLYERSMDPTLGWIDSKFSRPAGHRRGEQARAQAPATRSARRPRCSTRTTASGPRKLAARHVPEHHRQRGDRARLPRRVASSPTGRCSTARYPITPASDILHQLSGYKTFGVKTFQAEDEIAAIGAAIGASYGGALGLTASSGPGIALKTEAMGLAVMVELPLVVIDVQRAGPSTGMPTKNEQADLLQVMFGRNSDSPHPDRRAGDARRMLRPRDRGGPDRAQVHDPGRLPVGRVPRHRLRAVADPRPRRPPDIAVPNATPTAGPFQPYLRDPETLARPWAVPGTAGLEHRIGGLEKADVTGNVSYDPDNHHQMQLLRQQKVAGIANDIPPLEVYGPRTRRPADPRLGLDVRRHPLRGRAAAGGGSRPSPTRTCATSTRSRPTPRTVLRSYRRVLIPEVNLGQLLMLIRAKYLIDAVGYDRVRGKPFRIAEIVDEAERVLAEDQPT